MLLIAISDTKRRVSPSSSAVTDAVTRSGFTECNTSHSDERHPTEAVDGIQYAKNFVPSGGPDTKNPEKQQTSVKSTIELECVRDVPGPASHRPSAKPAPDGRKRAKHKVTGGPSESTLTSSAPALRGALPSTLVHQVTLRVRPIQEQWTARPQLEQTLKLMTELLSDEMRMRELLRPIEGSGKEKMREMGLRTRAYKKYFDAWEALHMTAEAETPAYARDDIIGYLRSQYPRADSPFSDRGLRDWTLAATVHAYESYKVFLHNFATLLFPWFMPYVGDHMRLHMSFHGGGRGIVLTAGDDQAPYLLTTIWSFRQLGCTLPIEVLYLGEHDLSEEHRADLERLPGVVTRDLAQMTNDEGWQLAGWAAKPFAILLSSFQEAIFIDADALFFQNPEILFDHPDYVRTGALFFKDRLMMPETKKRWLQQVLPKPIPWAARTSRWWTGESAHMQESGVIAVDKCRHFMSLMLVTRFNGPDRDGDKAQGIMGVYDMMYGDKETFWIGFLLAGDDNFAFHAGDTGVMGDLGLDDESAAAANLQYTDAVTGTDRVLSPAEQTILPAGATPSSSLLVSMAATPGQEVDLAKRAKRPSYTICNPQLLHLDDHNKPLWFNGWLLTNKFAHKSQKKFARFKHYLQESKDPGAWQLGLSNICCLTVDESRTFTFTEAEQNFLSLIIARAQDIEV